jgi:hypothetical protein
MRAAAHDGTKHRISSGGTESSTTTRCALETWSMLVAETAPHDRMPSGRQAAVATDDMRETARSMSPAADTTRQRRGACAQPVADSVQLPAAPHVASMRPCLAASGVDAELRYAPAPSQTKTASERGCGQPHLAHGRCDSGSTSSTTNSPARHWPSPCELQAPLGANRTVDARSESLLRMACLNSSRSLPSLPLCHAAPKNHLRRSSLPAVSDLGHAPVRSSACINGSGSKWPVFLGDSSCELPTAGDGRWGSRARKRGCSRRLPDQPSRHRLRRRLAPPCLRASGCPRGVAIVHSIPAGITTAVVSVRRVRTQTTARRSGATVVERTSCACWPRWRRQPGDVGMAASGSHH